LFLSPALVLSAFFAFRARFLHLKACQVTFLLRFGYVLVTFCVLA